MNSKEKMLEIIKMKQTGGGKSKKINTPKNDHKNMRKGPKNFNESVELQYFEGIIEKGDLETIKNNTVGLLEVNYFQPLRNKAKEPLKN